MSNACDLSSHRPAPTRTGLSGFPSIPGYTDQEAEEHTKAVGVNPRPAETRNELDERGAFVRQPNSFIVPFGSKEGEFRAEAGRYAIYWAEGCNWSNRPVIARDLLGLQDVISDTKTTHSGETNVYGHGFGDQPNHQDQATGAYFLSEFYKRANPDYKGRATTPTFVDIIEKKAVNNDYHRLSNYIEVQFRPFQPADAPDLYPKKFRDVIDEFNDWLFPHVNNGHYRMAFCSSIEAYQEAYDDFYASLDKLEERLATNRFLFGDYVTDADIRLYVTLVRWDTGYYRNIGPTKRRIVDYPNLWGYVRDLYAIPAFAKTTFFPKKPQAEDGRLFRDFNSRLAWQIDFVKLYQTDGERAKLSRTPEEKFLRHPAGETAEDYQSEISFSRWNRPDLKDRDPSDPANSPLRADASINPIDLHEAYT